MKLKNDSGERRQHPRFFPDKNKHPQVRFIFYDGERISVELINISRGGMLGSTSSIEQFLEIDHHKIKVIEIVPPNKEPFRCAGKLLRLHPLREENKCFCAVEFCKIAEEDQSTKYDESLETQIIKTEAETNSRFEAEMMKRVVQADNYLRDQNNTQAIKMRKDVYDSFSDITRNLSLEDRWWFYELLDEMKSREPGIPEELIQDFVNLCKNGLQDTLKDEKRPKLGLVKTDKI